MGKLKIIKDNVEALSFDFDTAAIFNKTTELNATTVLNRAVYCSTAQCYNCSEKKCTNVKCSNCNKCSACTNCVYDAFDSDCRD